MATKQENLAEKIEDSRRVIGLMSNYLTIYEFGKIEVSVEKIDGSGSFSKSENLTVAEKNALKAEFALGVQALKDKADEMGAILT